MNGMDGLWRFEVTGCALIDGGDAVISYGNLSGESSDGRYYWSGQLNLGDGTVLPSDLTVQSPDREKTYCTIAVTGTYEAETAQLNGQADGAKIVISMQKQML